MINTMLRFFATLLIAVCFTNAAAIRAEAEVSVKQAVENASVDQQAGASASFASDAVAEANEVASDHDSASHSDCDQHAACHHCHLGHCHFLIAVSGDIHVSLIVLGLHQSAASRLTGLEFPNPIRPPIS